MTNGHYDGILQRPFLAEHWHKGLCAALAIWLPVFVGIGSVLPISITSAVIIATIISIVIITTVLTQYEGFYARPAIPTLSALHMGCRLTFWHLAFPTHHYSYNGTLGQYDTMDPEHMRWIATQVQNGTALICLRGSHMSMYDDQQTYMNGLTKFILGVDAGEKKVKL